MRGIQRTNQISIIQMVCVLLICRFYQFLTYTPNQSGQAKGIWNLVSVLCSALLTLAFTIPVFLLNRRYPGLSMIECIGNASRGYAHVVAISYGIFALMVCIYTVATFNVFISSTILPQASMLFLSTTMILAAWYGASRGIEPSARLAFLVLIAFFLSAIWIVQGIVPYLKFHTITNIPDQHAAWNFIKSVWTGSRKRHGGNSICTLAALCKRKPKKRISVVFGNLCRVCNSGFFTDVVFIGKVGAISALPVLYARFHGTGASAGENGCHSYRALDLFCLSSRRNLSLCGGSLLLTF